ncbi:MAG TPA: class I SAM-dependent methyltransferase [Stellaceae bacterium]|nr:class I SAM-dependent methyltransferase [Stellaceae bacterium]
MAEPPIRFDDGAAYERMMGVWSQSAGRVFLDWLAPAKGLSWIDVGCGSGAFSELIFRSAAPAEIQGVDPSEGQLAFARTRPAAALAQFRQGDAMALPFPDGRFDVAVMALVIFFVPDAAKGVAEMARVTRPGGVVAAYAWDMPGGGFPLEPIQAEMRELGMRPPRPPSAAASRLAAMQALWSGAGLEAVETRVIEVSRTFADFAEFWSISGTSASLRAVLAAMPAADRAELEARVRRRLPADAAGRITYGARANAVKGRVPG